MSATKAKKPFRVAMGVKELDEAQAKDLCTAIRVHFGWPVVDESACKLHRDLETAHKQVVRLSESLWQAWKAFDEEGPDAAEKFLRAVCIDDGIMDKSGCRLASRKG